MRNEEASPDSIILQGRVRRVTFENESTGYRVIRFEVDDGRTETIVGIFARVTPDMELHVVGKRTNDPKFGPQILADSVTPITPNTRVGLIRYLGSGMVRGIGERLASRIVDHFGDTTLKVLDQGGERLAEVKGISPTLAKTAGEAWALQRASSDAMVFLRGHGITPSLASRIIKRYGSQTVSLVEQNPYRLAVEIRGVGFATADRIAQALGLPLDAPERMLAGVVHVLEGIADSGHTFTSREALITRTATELNAPEPAVNTAIDRAALCGTLVIEARNSHHDEQIFPTRLHQAEVAIANIFHTLLSTDAKPLIGIDKAAQAFENSVNISLAPAQREAIAAAAAHKALILTGGPGVGKTTLVRALLTLFDQSGLHVRLAAPTGRAARRLSESTKREATTIHRLLEVDARTMMFQRHRTNLLECDALIVDEASMIDIMLGCALVEALPPSARLILVGDVDQLPSVGPGALLRDLLECGAVPSVRLTMIYRQSNTSQIVEEAHAIRNGHLPRSSTTPDGDFFLIDRRDATTAKATIRELVETRISQRFGLDPRRDIQVLTPMRRGAAGVEALNEELQAALNPHGPTVGRAGKVLRTGDKVMQLRNDYERDVYNGDIGHVVSIDANTHKVTVRIEERNVDYTEENLDDLTLAYAISIHKSQGSEYPAVVIPWLRQHFVMLSRNLLYTGVTRGKRLVVLVADPYALELALADDRKEERRTSLRERLRKKPI